MKIKSIEKVEYNDDVYNLRIKSEDGLNHNYFANDICVSNCHKTKTISITSIMNQLWHCNYRFGVSGTLPKEGTADNLTVIAQTGPVINNINADSLIKQNYITPVKITVLKMDYADQETKNSFYELSKKLEAKELYQKEKKYVIANQNRFAFVTKLISAVTKNTLVLFHLIEHGKALFEAIKKIKKKDVYYVDGHTKTKDRELYKKLMESGEGRILIASYQTFATGISIKNIHNIFLTESFKSDILISQSIGRGLRLHKDKKELVLIDLVDDFSFDTIYGYTYENFIIKHSKHRISLYKKQNFPYEIKTVKL